jgi:ketosteroid isomerase-like protein
MADDNLALVRRMWAAYDQEGLEGILRFASEDAVWIPFSAGGRVFEGTDAYRAFVEEQLATGEVVEARAFEFEEGGDAVLVSGSMRIRRPGAFAENYVYWVHRFDGGEIVFTQSFSDPDEARAEFERPAEQEPRGAARPG